MSNITFTLDGAEIAQEIINECFEQAIIGLGRSVREENNSRIKYWLERVRHLINEMIWIEKQIKEIKAAATQQAKPPSTGLYT